MKIKSHTNADHHAPQTEKRIRRRRRENIVFVMRLCRFWQVKSDLGKKNLHARSMRALIVCVCCVSVRNWGLHQYRRRSSWRLWNTQGKPLRVNTNNKMLNWMCANMWIRVSRGNVALYARSTVEYRIQQVIQREHAERGATRRRSRRGDGKEKNTNKLRDIPTQTKATRAYYVANENYLGVDITFFVDENRAFEWS